MGFKNNYEKASNGNGIKPEGDYECIITAIEERTTPKGAKGLNFTLTVRNDVQGQKYGNSNIFYTIWRKKEPNEFDMQVKGYNFGQLMAMGKAVQLPDGKDYDSLEAYCEDLEHKCVRVTLEHKAYNGKERENVEYLNPTKFPNCNHKFKATANNSNTAENQNVVNTANSTGNFDDLLIDDGVPF